MSVRRANASYTLQVATIQDEAAARVIERTDRASGATADLIRRRLGGLLQDRPVAMQNKALGRPKPKAA